MVSKPNLGSAEVDRVKGGAQIKKAGVSDGELELVEIDGGAKMFPLLEVIILNLSLNLAK